MEALVQKIIEFEPQAKSEIINFLSAICSVGDRPYFVNQDIIFRNLIKNKEASLKGLMTITFPDGKDLFIKFKDRNNNE